MSARQVALPDGRVWVEYDIACARCGIPSVARVFRKMSIALVEYLPNGWASDDEAANYVRRYWCPGCVRAGARPR